VRRLALTLGFVSLFVPLASRPAWACSGCEGYPTIQEQARKSEVVFVGVAGLTTEKGTTFQPIVVYKGDPGDGAVEHGISDAECGLEFAEGKTYTVFASDHNGTLETNNCSHTQLGAVSPKKILLSAKPFESSPVPVPPPSSGGIRFSVSWFWLAFRLLAALAVPVFLFISIRVRNRSRSRSTDDLDE
jgi:hypothetical protein